MPQNITQFAVPVRDYDEALGFYIDKLGFEKLEDTDLGGGTHGGGRHGHGRLDAPRLGRGGPWRRRRRTRLRLLDARA